MTRFRRILYRVVILVCVVDMGIIAQAIHAHDSGFAKLSMGVCIAIAARATQQLCKRQGVEA